MLELDVVGRIDRSVVFAEAVLRLNNEDDPAATYRANLKSKS